MFLENLRENFLYQVVTFLNQVVNMVIPSVSQTKTYSRFIDNLIRRMAKVKRDYSLKIEDTSGEISL